MNKAEVLEIRKQFMPDTVTIDKICGCYVDHEKKRVFESKEAFGSLPDEEMYKYLDIFRHSLTGTIGKNLIPLEFPLEQEAAGGTQEFLMRLRDSKLEDDTLIDAFYERIIANYENAENYYIILVHAAYDIPGRASDNLDMDDASEDVFDYILASICPVKLSKAGLSYNAHLNAISDRDRDWVVDPPVKAFLFPAFIDRNTDIHNMLYFTKKPDDLQPTFVEALFGGRSPLSATDQKNTFDQIVQETVGDAADYHVMQNIHENLQSMMEEHKDDPEPLQLEKADVRALLKDSGVPQEQMDLQFEKSYEKAAGEEDQPLLVSNIANTRKFDIETPDVMIRVKPDRADLVESRIIDGRQCLVIMVDDHVEVNGINVRTFLN